MFKNIVKLGADRNADNVINWQITVNLCDNRTSLNLLLDNLFSRHYLCSQEAYLQWPSRSGTVTDAMPRSIAVTVGNETVPGGSKAYDH